MTEDERLRALEATDRCLSRLVREIADGELAVGSEPMRLELERTRGQLRRNRGLIPQATRDSELWTKEQYVDTTELPSADRVELAGEVAVPVVELVRSDDRIWTAEDYAALPRRTCHGPGYTLLRDVFLCSPGMALDRDGRFIDDRFTRLTPGGVSPAFRRELLLGPAARSRWPLADEPIERGILISGPGLRVYGHYLLDFLPALALLEEFDLFADWPLLLPSQAPAWVAPMVEVFARNRRELKRFPSERNLRIRVRELCVPWFPREPFAMNTETERARPRGAFHPRVASVFERIAAAVGDAPRPDGPTRICVLREPRGGSARRRLRNGDEIRALFESRGFRCLAPEHLSFRDQVRLFSGAEVVAGEAGSGLHGTLFSPGPMTTLELRPPTYYLLGQPAIAVLKGDTFVSTEGVEQGGGSLSREPWTLEPAAIERKLDALGL